MTVRNNQRWLCRRDSYRPAGEPIDPSQYGAVVIETAQAKRFVSEHHYSGSYPAARLNVGLLHAAPWRRSRLVGVAVFSVPMQAAAIGKYTGLPAAIGVELGRFVLLDEVPGNGETWFLGQAFRLLRQEKPEVRGVIAYADPVSRMTASGRLVKPGHVGTIYQAHNGRYLSRSSSRTLWLATDGTVISGRALSKLRADDQGAAYAYKQLLEHGAPRRKPLESSRAYVVRALHEGPFRKVRHPGNHVYSWGLDRLTKRALPAGLAYPKQAEALAAQPALQF